MLLSARFLINVCGVNSFVYSENSPITVGDAADIYIQIVDKSLDLPEAGFFPPYRRYMPLAGSTLTVEFVSTDSSRRYVKTATQPFPTLDPSIWMFSILSTEKVGPGNVQLKLTLTEPGKSPVRGLVQPGLAVNALSVFP